MEYPLGVYLIEKYFFKERRNALKIRFWKTLLKYRTSDPFLSGDAFAKLCDYSAYGKDGTKRLNIRKLRKATTLFVPGHRLHELLENHFEEISALVLICGNSDQNFVSDPVLPKSIKLWLCQNYAVKDGVGIVLPIGLENLRLGKSGFKKYQKFSSSNRIVSKVLLSPMNLSNPIREDLIRKCEELPDYFDVYKDLISTREYFDLIGNYRFVLVPEGNGYDTHRLWEVLYKGSVPILLDTPWARNIFDLGFKVTIISEISPENISSLLNSNQVFETSELLPELLYMDYWKKFIRKKL